MKITKYLLIATIALGILYYILVYVFPIYGMAPPGTNIEPINQAEFYSPLLYATILCGIGTVVAFILKK